MKVVGLYARDMEHGRMGKSEYFMGRREGREVKGGQSRILSKDRKEEDVRIQLVQVGQNQRAWSCKANRAIRLSSVMDETFPRRSAAGRDTANQCLGEVDGCRGKEECWLGSCNSPMAREKVALGVSRPERSGMKQISSLLLGCGPAEGGRQARQG